MLCVKLEVGGVTRDTLQLSPTVSSHILIYFYSLDFQDVAVSVKHHGFSFFVKSG